MRIFQRLTLGAKFTLLLALVFLAGMVLSWFALSQALQNKAEREVMSKAQMLLQSAVEGLSVAAVTYYGAGLVGYIAKGAKAAGWPVMPDVLVAACIPVIAFAVWMGIRRLHRRAHAGVE